MIKFTYQGKQHNFFHIPKTAGTSVFYLLEENFKTELVWQSYIKQYKLGSQHLSYEQYKPHILPSDINFTILRNPVDRIVSLYKNFIVNDIKDYESFLDWYLITKKINPHILKSQRELLKGGDFLIFHFDNLCLLEDYLNLKLPRYNVI